MKSWQERFATASYFDEVKKALGQAGLTELYFFQADSNKYSWFMEDRLKKERSVHRTTVLCWYLPGFAFMVCLKLREDFWPGAAESLRDPYSQYWTLEFFATLDRNLIPEKDVRKNDSDPEPVKIRSWDEEDSRRLTCKRFRKEMGSRLFAREDVIVEKRFDQDAFHGRPMRADLIIEALTELRDKIGPYFAKQFAELTPYSIAPTHEFPNSAADFWGGFPIQKLRGMTVPNGFVSVGMKEVLLEKQLTKRPDQSEA